jgi:nucleotide-binding universal stress UspA family protein
MLGPLGQDDGASGTAPQDAPVGVRPETLKFGHILVPTDFSDASKKALKYAARFAEQFGSRITLIHVMEPVMSPDFTHFPLALDEEKVIENANHRLLAFGKALLNERFIEGVIVRTGNPFHEIAEMARDRKFDLIIISTHGYTGLKRALLGSTAERVVRHAHCAVMTVR